VEESRPEIPSPSSTSLTEVPPLSTSSTLGAAGGGSGDGGDGGGGDDGGDGGLPSPSGSPLGRIQHSRDKEDEELNELLQKGHIWCRESLARNQSCIVDVDGVVMVKLLNVGDTQCSQQGRCSEGCCTGACKRFLCYNIFKSFLRLKWRRQKLPICVMLAISSLYGKSQTGFIKRI